MGCVFLKIISSQARRDIDLIRLIRNEVAHNANPITFDTPEIANRCRELGIPTSYHGAEPHNARERFLAVVSTYCLALAVRGLQRTSIKEIKGIPKSLRRALDDLFSLEVIKWLGE